MPTVAVRELPRSLRKVLKAVAYGQRDVEIRVQSEVSLSDAGGEGRRSVFYIVNLANGEHRTPKGSESGRTARLGRSGAVIKTGGESPGAVATIYVGRAESVPMMTVARLIPRQEDAERIIRALSVSTSAVARQRESENETAKLAEMVDREHKRRAKGEGREADEALARAEAILAAPAQTRTIHLYDPATGKPTGRTVPAGAIRETMLKRLNIEFGANAPIYATCANCRKVFAVKAGTSPYLTPKTCKNGCLCKCGRPISRFTALIAARAGYRASCHACSDKARGEKLTAEARAKTHCDRGHDLAIVGRRPGGACVQCIKDRGAARYAAKKAASDATKTKKTRCRKGHDLAVVGRDRKGQCSQCRRDAANAWYAAQKAAKTNGVQ